jgi:hypothetical protein
MLLKMNRCSVTRRCLLGENKNKKRKRRHDAAVSSTIPSSLARLESAIMKGKVTRQELQTLI